MWKRICCAVDFGEPSRAALEQAADLARFAGAELTVVHVVPQAPPAAIDLIAPSHDVAELEGGEEEELLEAWRGDAELRAGRPVRARLVGGDPARRILGAVREGEYDLVVVGTHGRTGLHRAVFGSVAERIARDAPCAVLVAHGGGWRPSLADREELAQYT